MNPNWRPGKRALALAVSSMCVAGAWAGSLQLRFVAPEHFRDAGTTAAERETVQQGLRAHLEALATKQLPAAQTLDVEILDLDLAGEMHPGRRQDVRVLRGAADWPRITLRFRLHEGERTLTQGEEDLVDLDYLHAGTTSHGDAALAHEKRLLDRWFRERLSPAR